MDNYLEVYKLEEMTMFSLEKKSLVTIGRTKENKLQITNTKTISRFHCFLFYKDYRWHVQDGNFNAVNGDIDQWSTNGTFLNGYCIKEKYDLFVLKDGDIISFSTKDYVNDIPRIIFKGNNGFIECIQHPTVENEYE